MKNRRVIHRLRNFSVRNQIHSSRAVNIIFILLCSILSLSNLHRRNIMKTQKEKSEFQMKMRLYYWKCFLSEFSKTFIFFIIFSYFNYTREFFMAILALMVLRSLGGGIHAKHYITCLMISFLFISGSILLAEATILPHIFMCLTIPLCAIIGYFLAPITSNNRPAIPSPQRKRYKRNTAIVILLFFPVILYCPHNIYILICYWTIILHITQLFIAFIKEVIVNEYF